LKLPSEEGVELVISYSRANEKVDDLEDEDRQRLHAAIGLSE
jgi:hypothetical protein